MGTFRYFAYGSNMLGRRLCATDRCPSAKLVGTGYIEGRRLTFDKVSQVTERDALAKAEGVGKGYSEETVTVVTDGGAVESMAVIATRKDPALRPYHWYKALVVAGAVENDLPAEYVQWLRTVESVEDPNRT